MIEIYCYRDHKDWGEMCAQSFRDAGFQSKMFTCADEIPNLPVKVFVMQHHSPSRREPNKKLTTELGLRKNLFLIPSRLENRLYDDKVAQYKHLLAYMPISHILESRDFAIQVANRLDYPFISKSSQGAASSNVDLIQTKEDAYTQIDQAFGDGIPRHYGLKQRGYLFWQEFMAGNAFAYRVTMLNNQYAWITKKPNRDDSPFASGSPYTIKVNTLDAEAMDVLEFCSEIACRHGLIFTAMDVIFDHTQEPKQPLLLEISTDWVTKLVVGNTAYKRTDNKWSCTDVVGKADKNFFPFLPLIWGTK